MSVLAAAMDGRGSSAGCRPRRSRLFGRSAGTGRPARWDRQPPRRPPYSARRGDAAPAGPPGRPPRPGAQAIFGYAVLVFFLRD